MYVVHFCASPTGVVLGVVQAITVVDGACLEDGTLADALGLGACLRAARAGLVAYGAGLRASGDGLVVDGASLGAISVVSLADGACLGATDEVEYIGTVSGVAHASACVVDLDESASSTLFSYNKCG
jgi:hypothetical protein